MFGTAVNQNQQSQDVSQHLTTPVDKFYEWNSAYPYYLQLLSPSMVEIYASSNSLMVQPAGDPRHCTKHCSWFEESSMKPSGKFSDVMLITAK